MSVAPQVVLLHGFTNTGASWAPVVAGLGERYRAFAPDLRGHGSASAAEPVTLDAVIEDIEAAADDRFTLCGYSQGGRIALHLAVRMPDRVSRLVLVGASPGLADAQERARRRAADERLADELEQLTIEQFADRWAATPILAGVAPEAAATARRDRLRNDPAGLARALRGLGTGALPPLWDRLHELTMPVRLIAGEHDAKFSQIAREMAQTIRSATVTIVPGAGHAVHLERPDAIVEALCSGVPAKQSVAETGPGGH